MGNAPAFQLFASDFFMDTISWTVEEVGIYTRLLLAQWTNGPLDSEPVRLARIAGISVKKFNKYFPKISTKFQIYDPQNDSDWNHNGEIHDSKSHSLKIYNLRLEETRQKQKSYIESQQLKGKLSAEKRVTTVRTTVKPRLQPKANSSSSSSSSSKKINNKPLPLCPDFISTDVWNNFIEHRKAFKPKLSEIACRLIFDRLKQWKDENGWSPDAILNQSIENGWKGIFELKKNTTQGVDLEKWIHR